LESTSLKAQGLAFSAWCAGPIDGPLVLLLHGFPDVAATFTHQFEPLADAGFRVVAPTMRGYQPSSQPANGDYSLMTLADDVVGWLDYLGADTAHLVGHDWGAAVAYVVAARFPDRFSTLTTLAVPPLARIPAALRHVPRQLLRSWYMTFFQLRRVADRALTAGEWWLLRRLWSSWSQGYIMADREWQALRKQFELPGVVGASLAYYRHNATPSVLLGIRATEAMEPGPINVATLIIHGTNDGCMDRRLFGHTVLDQDFPQGVDVIEVANGGHFVHLEQPDTVNAALLRHLSA
jgi:pimeloyl-ACP methyl ester carboxylesterase